MPATLTYPGVYIQELSSGVRTITGVATSTAAFVGRADRGPVNDATTITSWADFQRIFGGLRGDYPLGYAVRQFYDNGGGPAVIVRTFNPANKSGAKITVGGLALEAGSPGEWGNHLRVRVDQDDITAAVATSLGIAQAKLFNLRVRDMNSGVTETYATITSEDTPRRVDRALAGSTLIKLTGSPAVPSSFHPAPGTGKTIWDDPAASSEVQTADRSADSGTVWDVSEGDPAARTGIYALDRVDLFNILCLPPDEQGKDTPKAIWSKALTYCAQRRAMLLVDPPASWTSAADIKKDTFKKLTDDIAVGSGVEARNAAIYFPRVLAPDPNRGNLAQPFVPCGMVAGIMARTDTQRGVWKAPAGVDATLGGAQGLTVPLNDAENGLLNPGGINCLRTFPIVGTIVWGARTMRGADLLGDEYKYVPVRRLALFLEESLYRGLQWVVFEPNDEPLWAQIRLNVGAFLHDQFRQGAFQGSSPREAYFVKCDKDTTTQSDINLGIVNIVVGFAPLKPAEFVVLTIQQIAGQIQV
jgi:phage tail sheath protein FI